MTSVTVVTRLADSNDVGNEPGYMQSQFGSARCRVLPKGGMRPVDNIRWDSLCRPRDDKILFRVPVVNHSLSKPFHLLLVDDESSVLQTLRMVLENEGYNVVTAESCTQAMALLQTNAVFDGVITDLNMEREDIGLEVARVALQGEPRPVIVVLTGFASMSNSRQALDLGIDYMAHKPVELGDLLPALSRLVSRRRESESQ